MRAASSNFRTNLESDVTNLCRLFRVTRKDGTTLRFTDAVDPVVRSGGEYRSDISFDCSAIALAAVRGASQSVNITVRLSEDGFREQDFRSRLYQSAVLEVFAIDYRHPQWGIVKLFRGVFGNIRIVEDAYAQIDFGPFLQQRNPTIAFEPYSMTCAVDLGGTRCGVDLEAQKETLTVTSFSHGGGNIIVGGSASGGAHADGYWGFGFVRWLTGANVGAILPVRYSVGSGATTTLYLSYAASKDIEVGDTASAYPGCDKVVTTCRDTYDNVDNFRGFPWVPNMTSINYAYTTVASHAAKFPSSLPWG